MNRRREIAHRPAFSEEIQLWSQAATALTELATIYGNATTVETIDRVNRLILAWPTDDQLPAEGLDSVKTVHKKLTAGLHDIQTAAEREAKAIEEVLEDLGVLIALRSAPAEALPLEKRNKRPRANSPAAPTVGPIAGPMQTPRGTSIFLPPRGSIGPMPFSREPKARREALAKQLPLQEGRKVAFHPPAGKPTDGSASGNEENTWILAVITRCINQDKNRYEVQDAENQDDGQPGPLYNTTLRAIIPLPDPDADPSSASHLYAYHEFPRGSIVMALYPDTTCFYRAEVLASPSELQQSGRLAPDAIPQYRLKFEEDNDQETMISATLVVEYPK